MNKKDIIRAWKDEEYRDGLSEAERSALPFHPAGLVEIRDEDIKAVAGGTATTICTQWTGTHYPNCCC
jgi:mersacidin/lichenicidin family type 2 lantibiotic